MKVRINPVGLELAAMRVRVNPVELTPCQNRAMRLLAFPHQCSNRDPHKTLKSLNNVKEKILLED